MVFLFLLLPLLFLFFYLLISLVLFLSIYIIVFLFYRTCIHLPHCRHNFDYELIKSFRNNAISLLHSRRSSGIFYPKDFSTDIAWSCNNDATNAIVQKFLAIKINRPISIFVIYINTFEI